MAQHAAELMEKIENTTPVADITDPAAYDAVFVPGGHAVCFDMPFSEPVLSLLGKFADSDKIVASVCHGPAALVNVKLANGKPLVDGKSVRHCFWACALPLLPSVRCASCSMAPIVQTELTGKENRSVQHDESSGINECISHRTPCRWQAFPTVKR